MEAESLYKAFCAGYKLFKGSVAVFGKRVLNHFNLVELMSANHSAFVCTIAACFSAEARRIAYIFFGKLGFFQNFVTMERNKCGFGCGEHETTAFVLGNVEPINLVFKLRELTCRKTAFVTEHMRHKNKLKAVAEMCVDKIVK